MTDETFEEFKERVRKQYRPIYLDKQGKEIPVLEWGRLVEDENYKIVKQTSLGDYLISTVWMGLNMAFFRDEKPLIFETMIFCENEETKKEDRLHMFQERYSNEQDAIEGHEIAIGVCRLHIEYLEAKKKGQERRVEENGKGLQPAV